VLILKNKKPKVVAQQHLPKLILNGSIIILGNYLILQNSNPIVNYFWPAPEFLAVLFVGKQRIEGL
jgi:hypothetical protein